jgi:hypothetical protein
MTGKRRRKKKGKEIMTGKGRGKRKKEGKSRK